MKEPHKSTEVSLAWTNFLQPKVGPMPLSPPGF